MRVVALVVLVACTDRPPTNASGVVAVEQFVSDGGIASSNVHAIFSDTPQGAYADGFHGCSLYLDPPTDSTFSAGEIELTGTLQPIVLEPSGTAPHVSYVATQAPPNPIFMEDAAIAFHVTGGGDIPELDGTLTAPAATLPGYQPPLTPLSRNGIHVAWTPSGLSSEVEVLLVADSSTTTDSAIIDCLVEDTGTVDIAASLLAAIPDSCDTAVLGVGPWWNLSELRFIGDNRYAPLLEVVLRSLVRTDALALVP